MGKLQNFLAYNSTVKSCDYAPWVVYTPSFQVPIYWELKAHSFANLKCMPVCLQALFNLETKNY